MINTIGPVWDGNEVWLLTAGGATFAAFPEWYATLFSGFYLALLLILLALIARIVAFEWRGKINDDRWRAWFDRGIIVGSWMPAVLWGVAFGNIVRGVHLDAEHQYAGNFFDLLNPFALLGGATTALIFLTPRRDLHVAEDRRRHPHAGRQPWPTKLAMATLVVAGVWAVWLQLAYSNNTWTWGATGDRRGRPDRRGAGSLGSARKASPSSRRRWRSCSPSCSSSARCTRTCCRDIDGGELAHHRQRVVLAVHARRDDLGGCAS